MYLSYLVVVLTDSWLNLVCDVVCSCTWLCFYLHMVSLRNSRFSYVFHHGIVNYTNMSPWLFVSIFLLLEIPDFASDDDISSDVSIFLLNFRSLFSFPLRTDFIKPVLFCVDRVRLVLIYSTKVVLFFSSFWIASCLFCISDRRSEFSFSGKMVFVSRVLVFNVSVSVKCCEVWY